MESGGFDENVGWVAWRDAKFRLATPWTKKGAQRDITRRQMGEIDDILVFVVSNLTAFTDFNIETREAGCGGGWAGGTLKRG